MNLEIIGFIEIILLVILLIVAIATMYRFLRMIGLIK